jgi:hypothetical protein
MLSHPRALIRSIVVVLLASVLLALVVAMPASAVTAPPVIGGATLSGFHAHDGYVTLPLSGALFDCTKPTVTVTYAAGAPVNASKTTLWIDGKKVPATAITQTQLTAVPSLVAGAHVAKAQVTDTAGRRTTASWPFTIRSPHLEADVTGVFRDAGDATLVHVLWLFKNTGTAEVWETRIAFTADSGATYVGDANEPGDGPSFVYSLAPGAAKTGETLFRVPAGASSFHVRYHSGLGGETVGGVWDDFQDSLPLFKTGSASKHPSWRVRLP